MPQHDLDIANGSGAAVRADLNGALAALGSTMKGPNAPPAPVAGMMWVEDDNPSSTRWTVRMYDGADWIALGILDATANIFELSGTTAFGRTLLASADLAAAQSALSTSWSLCEAPRVVTSVAQADFLLPAAFRRYRLTIQDGTVSTSGQSFGLRFSSDGGATFLTAATYQQIGNRTDGTAANTAFATSSATSIALSPGLPVSTVNAWDATFDVNPGSGSLSARVRGNGIGVDSAPTWAHGYWGGAWLGTSARMNALRVFVASGNLSGTLILEGMR
jgi:hypothetical protein